MRTPMRLSQVTGDVSDDLGDSEEKVRSRPTDNGQISIIDPDCRLIGLQLYDRVFKDDKDACHLKTYELSLKDGDCVEALWSQNVLDNGADLLIPVPPPFCRVLISGEN
ncbi:hypothetical protein L2E82_14138 [Cichorium intybus]|uniref:Uncharacterized protein n=1 Tax=Cichorium intybus TaxID=13427 RepID=A0ACB9EZR5_CICIN|nr:hypothetical protein L2E82_14138 [Cichorium intybus]